MGLTCQCFSPWRRQISSCSTCGWWFASSLHQCLLHPESLHLPKREKLSLSLPPCLKIQQLLTFLLGQESDVTTLYQFQPLLQSGVYLSQNGHCQSTAVYSVTLDKLKKESISIFTNNYCQSFFFFCLTLRSAFASPECLFLSSKKISNDPRKN